MTSPLVLPHSTISRIANMAPATPALWNDKYEEIDENFAALKTAIDTLQGLTGDASITSKGIIQLAQSVDLSQGTDDTKAVTPKVLIDYLSLFGRLMVPIGTVLHYLGSTIPTGFLLCNGASLSRTEYPELFSVIGTKCGSDSPSTFKIPDTHHRVLEGTTVLSEVGKYIEAGLPNIKGSFQAYSYNGTYSLNQEITNGAFKTVVSNKNATLSNGTSAGTNDYFLDLSSVNDIYGSASTNQPASLRSLCLIRAY